MMMGVICPRLRVTLVSVKVNSCCGDFEAQRMM
jgi:hypothetical protein